jgi:hypothetical protein
MLKTVFRVTTTQYNVGADDIEAGMVITLDNTTGLARLCDSTEVPIGISADRKRASTAGEWVNRLASNGDETAASGKLSVYHSGGEFWIDVDDSAITTPAGGAITGVITAATATADAIKPGLPLYTAANGQVSNTAGGETMVFRVLEAGLSSAVTTGEGVAISTGIPGEYEPGASVDYATDGTERTWAKVKLLI